MAELSNQKPKVIAVVGATATGKTALGVALCKAIGGEVISADSMQIYQGLDVGTAKVSSEETQGVPHHCVDILQPNALFSVADFIDRATQITTDLTAQQKHAVLVGGTGQYVESFLKGVRFSKEKPSSDLRDALAKQLAEQGSEAMYARLCDLDPEAAVEIHPNNTVRVLRALEHFDATGRKISAQKANSLPEKPPYDSLVIGLDFPDRAKLYERINMRVDIMLSQGLLQEAEQVYQNRAQYITAAQAIGYKEFFPYFEGSMSLEECVEKLKQASRKYAKRQMTWFRHMENIVWLDAGAADVIAQSVAIAEKFLARG
ncbi:MAG: tRNA (adenosine(37)-N6)-dimethylallyltransferase MiaA [Faecalibacterium sp.]